MKDVTQIVFKATLKGCGGVNYDKLDVVKHMVKRWYLQQNVDSAAFAHDNIKCLKADYERIADDKIKRTIKISRDCLRNAIFAEAYSNFCMDMWESEELRIKYLASPAALLRGAMYASGAKPCKRKSPFTITDARASDDCIPSLSLGTNHASTVLPAEATSEKVSESDKKRGYRYDLPKTSMFVTENIGEVTYTTQGFIDIKELRFLSADDRYLREYINRDNIKEVLEILNQGYAEKDHAVEGAFIPKHCVCGGIERGIYLSNMQTLDIVKYLFKKMLSLNITRSGSYAAMSELKIAVVDTSLGLYNAFDENASDFITLSSEADIDNLKMVFETAYILDEKSSSNMYGSLQGDIDKARTKRLKTIQDSKENEDDAKAKAEAKKKEKEEKEKKEKVTK